MSKECIFVLCFVLLQKVHVWAVKEEMSGKSIWTKFSRWRRRTRTRTRRRGDPQPVEDQGPESRPMLMDGVALEKGGANAGASSVAWPLFGAFGAKFAVAVLLKIIQVSKMQY